MFIHLADACREARVGVGASQALMAALLGVSQATIARFERSGRARDPERCVDVYAVVGGTTSAEIWGIALTQYFAANSTVEKPTGEVLQVLLAIVRLVEAIRRWQ